MDGLKEGWKEGWKDGWSVGWNTGCEVGGNDGWNVWYPKLPNPAFNPTFWKLINPSKYYMICIKFWSLWDLWDLCMSNMQYKFIFLPVVNDIVAITNDIKCILNSVFMS